MSQEKPKSELSEKWWTFSKDTQIRIRTGPEGHDHPLFFRHHVHKDGKPIERPCLHPDCIVREIMES